jgi:hypothetical protein
VALPTPQDIIKMHIEGENTYSSSVLVHLRKLNIYQRKMIIDHVREQKCELLSVGQLGCQKLDTVF